MHKSPGPDDGLSMQYRQCTSDFQWYMRMHGIHNYVGRTRSGK
jgi:hypothetical protein